VKATARAKIRRTRRKVAKVSAPTKVRRKEAESQKPTAAKAAPIAKAKPAPARKRKAKPRVRTANHAKRLYKEGKLSREAYRGIITPLKLVRRDRILAAKKAYRDGKVDKPGYRALRVKIDEDYWGPK
jgi:hypothetical protein